MVNVQVPVDLCTGIDEAVNAGAYASRSDFIRHAIEGELQSYKMFRSPEALEIEAAKRELHEQHVRGMARAGEQTLYEFLRKPKKEKWGPVDK